MPSKAELASENLDEIENSENNEPSKAELASEIDVEELENVLKGHQYLAGDKATQVDIKAFEGLAESPSFWKFRVSLKTCYRSGFLKRDRNHSTNSHHKV